MLNFMPLFQFQYEKHPELWLQRYQKQLIDGRNMAPEKAKPKYDWLFKYAREFVASEISSFKGAVFGIPLLPTLDALGDLKAKEM